MPGSPKKPVGLRQRHERGDTKDLMLRDEAPPVPLPPKGLLKRQQQRWLDYWETQVARAVDPVADLHRIERWIRAVDEYERVYPVFRKQRLSTGSTGQMTLNPLATYLANLEGQIAKAETELGLTPMARLRLGIAYGQAKLTAQQLNEALNQGTDGAQSEDDRALLAEWEEA